jgi:hypothetical protein
VSNYYSGFPPLPHTSTGDWRDKDNLLYKVWSIKKKNELFKVLQNPNASHFERLWLVGFLKWVKYGYKDILNIIHNLNEWSDYDSNITKIQVHSVFYSSHYDNRPYRSKPAGTLNKGSYSFKDESSDIIIPPEPICTADACLNDKELVRTLRNFKIKRELLKDLQILTLIDILESLNLEKDKSSNLEKDKSSNLEKDKSSNLQKDAPAEREHKSFNHGNDKPSLHSSRFLTKRGGA